MGPFTFYHSPVIPQAVIKIKHHGECSVRSPGFIMEKSGFICILVIISSCVSIFVDGESSVRQSKLDTARQPGDEESDISSAKLRHVRQLLAGLQGRGTTMIKLPLALTGTPVGSVIHHRRQRQRMLPRQRQRMLQRQNIQSMFPRQNIAQEKINSWKMPVMPRIENPLEGLSIWKHFSFSLDEGKKGLKDKEEIIYGQSANEGRPPAPMHPRTELHGHY